MYVVWRQRPVKGAGGAAFLHDPGCIRGTYDDTPWKPIECRHRGTGRVAWTPLAVKSERVGGKPRQKLVYRFPSIRSCCIADRFCRAAWWYDVERTFQGWGEMWCEEGTYLARDLADMIATLRKVVPAPTPAGVRDFTAYREAREAGRKARDDRNRAFWHEQAAANQRAWEEAQRRRRAEEQAAAEELLREYLRRGDRAEAFAILGLTSTATPDQVKASYRELARRHHPDMGGDAKEFTRIVEAYEAAFEQATRKATA